ncbi:MAG: 3-oxoacyl-ACP synthase [Oligoflexia bacterium]|nr:3-oxoacyl-ACP synthase [Oligoflexia bacterium]
MKILKPNLLIRIEGASRSWPDKEPISNHEILANHPETKDKPEAVLQEFGERIYRGYGFRKRYMTRLPWKKADPTKEENSESLSIKAIKKIFSKKKTKKPDAFILGSTTTRRYTGSQATSALAPFDLEIPAYEIKAGCSTSLASLHLAQALMKQGYETVLVSCAETLSKVAHPEIRETWFGLADGGAALLLHKVKSKGHFKILRSTYSTDGKLVDLYTTPGELPPNIQTIEEHGFSLVGDGSKLKDAAKIRYMQMINGLLSNKEKKSIRWIVPHQVNRALTEEVIRESGLKGTVLWDAEDFGNIGGASVLFSFAKAIEENRFKKNDLIFFMSVGGGLSFAAQLWKKL